MVQVIHQIKKHKHYFIWALCTSMDLGLIKAPRKHSTIIAPQQIWSIRLLKTKLETVILVDLESDRIENLQLDVMLKLLK